MSQRQSEKGETFAAAALHIMPRATGLCYDLPMKAILLLALLLASCTRPAENGLVPVGKKDFSFSEATKAHSDKACAPILSKTNIPAEKCTHNCIPLPGAKAEVSDHQLCLHYMGQIHQTKDHSSCPNHEAELAAWNKKAAECAAKASCKKSAEMAAAEKKKLYLSILTSACATAR